MTVAELDERMSSSEYAKWSKYYSEEPFGQERDNWHMANLAALYANSHRGKGVPAIKMDKFMWKTESEHKQNQTLDTFSSLKAMAKKK